MWSRSSSSRPIVVSGRARSICLLQIHPRKHVLHSDYTPPSRQHELCRSYGSGGCFFSGFIFPCPVSRLTPLHPFPAFRVPFTMSHFPHPGFRFLNISWPVSRVPFPVYCVPCSASCFPGSRFPRPVSRFPFPMSPVFVAGA